MNQIMGLLQLQPTGTFLLQKIVKRRFTRLHVHHIHIKIKVIYTSAHIWQKIEKYIHSLHAPAIKFIGKNQLV